MNERCERIVVEHSVPWKQYILVLMNFIREPLSEIWKTLFIFRRISKFELFRFHPIFLSEVFQNLCFSSYYFGDMK